MADQQALDACAVVEGVTLPKGLVLPLAGTALAIALALVSFFEGNRFTAYQDIGGVWTICDGHTGGVQPGQVATKAECDAFKQADLESAQRAVERLIVVPLPPSRQAALIDFVINTGPATLEKSSVRRELNAGHTAAGCAAITLYHYVGQRDCRLASSGCPGIVTRRNVERQLCELNP